VKSVVGSNHAGHPLFLRSVCNELRLFGDYFQLSNIVAYYSEAQSLQHLYGKIFARWEKDYCAAYPGLLEETFTLISASHSGLVENDLRELLGVPQNVWSPLFLAMQETLQEQGGLLMFAHFLIEQAALNYYPMDEERSKSVRKKLVTFFKNHAGDERAAIELPYQYFKLEDKDSLKAEIVKLGNFVRWFNFDRLTFFNFVNSVAQKDRSFLQTWKRARRARGHFSNCIITQLEADTESRANPNKEYADKIFLTITCMSALSQYSGLEALFLLALEQNKTLYSPTSRRCGTILSSLGKHILKNAAWVDNSQKLALYMKAIGHMEAAQAILEKYSLRKLLAEKFFVLLPLQFLRP